MRFVSRRAGHTRRGYASLVGWASWLLFVLPLLIALMVKLMGGQLADPVRTAFPTSMCLSMLALPTGAALSVWRNFVAYDVRVDDGGLHATRRETARKKLRIASESSAEPKLRIALENLASDAELDERAIEEALDAEQQRRLRG